VSTADAYAWLDADRADAARVPPLDRAGLREAARASPTLTSAAVNDLEAPVVARHRVIDSYRAHLRQGGARIAMMSGSGSAVFGLFAEEPDVAAIARACDAPVIATRAPARVVAHLGSE
jgi:4-diphosphocytidyl-2C-methyl-D-erythritol kinase